MMLAWVVSTVLGFAAAEITPALIQAAASVPAIEAGAPSKPNATAENASPAATALADAPAVAVLGPTVAITATDAAASAEPPAPPAPSLTASIDLTRQLMVVSEHGVEKHTWPISSGAAGYATPRGTFRPEWTAKMWYSRKYDWAPMPHAVFINGGVAVHATQHVRALGTPASHGCIRLAPANAKIFYGLVHRHGLKLTSVDVHGAAQWRAPAVASRKKAPVQYAAAPYEPFSLFPAWGSPPTSAFDPGFTKRAAKSAKAARYGVSVSSKRPPRNRVIHLPPRSPRYVMGSAN